LLLTSHKPEVVMSARRSLSLIYKKAHRWEDATRLWQDLLAANPKDVFAGEELAKFFEHHAREFGKALEIVSKLLYDSIHLSDDERVSLEHRLQRLHKHI